MNCWREFRGYHEIALHARRLGRADQLVGVEGGEVDRAGDGVMPLERGRVLPEVACKTQLGTPWFTIMDWPIYLL